LVPHDDGSTGTAVPETWPPLTGTAVCRVRATLPSSHHDERSHVGGIAPIGDDLLSTTSLLSTMSLLSTLVDSIGVVD
jgi:hypothetical protein